MEVDCNDVVPINVEQSLGLQPNPFSSRRRRVEEYV